MLTEKYEVVIVGGGPGGYVAAIRAAQLGMSVAVIEKEHLGGICLNWGCIPTKAMLKSAEVFSIIKKAEQYGIVADNVEFNLEKIIQRSKKIAEQLSAGVKHLLSKHKVTVIEGIGSLQSKNKIKVVTKEQTIEITARNINPGIK